MIPPSTPTCGPQRASAGRRQSSAQRKRGIRKPGIPMSSCVGCPLTKARPSFSGNMSRHWAVRPNLEFKRGVSTSSLSRQELSHASHQLVILSWGNACTLPPRRAPPSVAPEASPYDWAAHTCTTRHSRRAPSPAPRPCAQRCDAHLNPNMRARRCAHVAQLANPTLPTSSPHTCLALNNTSTVCHRLPPPTWPTTSSPASRGVPPSGV